MEQETPNMSQGRQSSSPSGAPEGHQTPIQKNTLMAVLSYLSILVIIPLLIAKDDPFVKFHIKQGLVLAIIGLIISAVSMGMMVWLFFPIIGIINFGLLLLSIMGIVHAIQGQEKKLPLVGHLADNFTF